MKQRLGAVLAKRGVVLESGYNQLRHQSAVRTRHYPGSLHAEVNVLSKMIRSGRMSEIKGSELYIVRLKRDGSYGLAAPCHNCLRLILALKVRSVIYSNDDNNFSTLIL